MAPDPSTRNIPIAPVGRRAGNLVPAFEADPIAWFTWIERAIDADPAAAVRDIRPATYVDHRGRGWRVIVTEVGPEIRPGLENPFLVYGALPLVTATLVTPAELLVELTTIQCRRVQVVPRGRVPLVSIGLAMLTSTELPHDAIERVGEETWNLARRRWVTAQAAASASAPSPALEIQPFDVRPARSR